jgi:hypothetical protein
MLSAKDLDLPQILIPNVAQQPLGLGEPEKGTRGAKRRAEFLPEF